MRRGFSGAVVCTPAVISPTPAERAISGQLTVVNNTFNDIQSVAVVYCGDDTIPANEQTCNETPLSAARIGSNALWPLSQSVNNSYYNYFLVEDAQAEPMEVGNNYLLAWAKAMTEDGEFISDKQWIAVPFPSKYNFKVIIPSRLWRDQSSS